MLDSHFHLLELDKRGVDIKRLIQELEDAGWHGGIDIGVAQDDLALRSKLCAPYRKIRLAAGIGPWGAQGEEPVQLAIDRLVDHIAPYDFEFVGEIGLDYHWNYGTARRQRDLFEGQLRIAREMGKPVIIHTRDADDDMRKILRTTSFAHGGIMHCFSSKVELLETALDADLHISFAGPITYRKNETLRGMLARVPLERLLLETDSPYLSPEPFRGKVNTPMHMPQIYEQAARVLDIDVQDLVNAIQLNFDSLCSLPDRS